MHNTFYVGHPTSLQHSMVISTCLTSNACVYMKYKCVYITSLNYMSTSQRLPNGSIDTHDDGSRVSELKELLDRTNKDLTQSREHSTTLSVRIAELEAELTNARRELSRSEELSIKQQREQREVMCRSSTVRTV